MSQSDYLKLKRTMRRLREPDDFAPILMSSEYTSGVNYNLETTVVNTKPLYHHLTPPETQIVFDMERKLTVDADGRPCPEFILCTNTHTRANRRPPVQIGFPVIKSAGHSVPKDVSDPIQRKIATIPNADRRKNCKLECS